MKKRIKVVPILPNLKSIFLRISPGFFLASLVDYLNFWEYGPSSWYEWLFEVMILTSLCSLLLWPFFNIWQMEYEE
jgi:hypothetical protein